MSDPAITDRAWPTEGDVERAAAYIYRAKGDRYGKRYVGWENEPEHVKDEWREDVRDTLRAAPAPPPVPEPDGWRLVPVEPTEAMMNAGFLGNICTARDIYRAMLAAAPPSPEPRQTEQGEGA